MLICILCLVGGTACPASFPANAAAPAPLPDLYISSGDIVFWVGDIPTYGATVGTAVVNISVYVNDKGLDNITSANVTLEINGTPFGVSPVVYDPAGMLSNLVAYFVWNTSSLPPANYTVRARVNDSAGDLVPEDNAAETNFTIAPNRPVLVATFDSISVTAVPSVQSLSVNFSHVGCTGDIKAMDLFGRQLVVDLRAATDNGWEALVSPQTVVFGPETSHGFTVIVTVPRTARADRPGTLWLNATASIENATVIATAKTAINIGSSFIFDLEPKKAYVEIAPGSKTVITVNLTNMGNSYDSFLVEIINQRDLASNHASANLSTQKVEGLGPRETATFKTTFRSSKDWTIWKSMPNVIIIKVTSLGARASNQTITLSEPFYVYERGSYPAWYSCYTFGALSVVLFAALVAGLWNRRRKRKKTGEPASRGAGEPVTGSRETG